MIELCGSQLPWVDKIVHLGMTVTNKSDIIESDMNIKKACYVSRNIELNQEFHFTTSETKIKINELYNSSWFGSVMYKLYGAEAVRLESSYNRSMKTRDSQNCHKAIPITSSPYQRSSKVIKGH